MVSRTTVMKPWFTENSESMPNSVKVKKNSTPMVLEMMRGKLDTPCGIGGWAGGWAIQFLLDERGEGGGAIRMRASHGGCVKGWQRCVAAGGERGEGGEGGNG